MALRGQQHCSIYSESLVVFRNHLVVELEQLLLWPRKDVSASLRRRTRFPQLPLLLRPSILHPRTHSLPNFHSILLPPPHFPALLRSRSPPLSFPMSSLTNPPPDSNATKTDRVVIKGRVQGVFYRDWTVENARDLGLKGWVRNRRDGSVEALFSGPPEKVQEMEQRCRRGPPAAAVTKFEAFPCNDDPGTGFERRTTV